MLHEPTKDFDFEKLSLGSVNSLQGGSYFTKILMNNEALYLQTPKCITKQGMVVTEKKKYVDLMFSSDTTDVISWFEEIEKKAQEMMFSKKNIWFHDDIEFSDIENAFTSPIRSYKSGRYNLVRCSLPKIISAETISCYNEHEQPVSIEEMNNQDTEIIPLLEIQGIKFSSKNFQLEIGMRQVMILKKKNVFKECLIKMNSRNPVSVAQEPETVVAPEPETVVAPEPETVVAQEPETVVAPEPETVVAPEPETVVTPEPETVVAPEPENNNEDSSQEAILSLNEKENKLEEVTLSIPTMGSDMSEPMVLKDPNEVYYEMWKTARQKARLAKKEALAAYLEAKQIKENYMLDGIDTDSDEEEEYEMSNLA